MASPKRYKFAVFGAGRMGSIHIRDLVISSRAEVTWIVEEDEARARDAVQRYNIADKTRIAGISQMQQVLADDSVDVIMVCTPAFSHNDIVQAGLQAGKAVFCEKPLAPTLEATEAAYVMAEKCNEPLFCAFNRRFDPQLSKLHAMVKSGELGEVRYISQISRDPASMMTEAYLKTSGGILVDSVVHDIDTCLWLVGEVPETVYAVGRVKHPMYGRCGDVDISLLVLTFPCGVIATLNMCREIPYGNDTRVEIIGSQAMATTGNKRPMELTKVSLDGNLLAPIYLNGVDRYMDSYMLELEHFLDVLDGKTEMLVTRESTLNAIKVVNVAKLSMTDGKVHKFSG